VKVGIKHCRNRNAPQMCAVYIRGLHIGLLRLQCIFFYYTHVNRLELSLHADARPSAVRAEIVCAAGAELK
jgi:hypothetical protein